MVFLADLYELSFVESVVLDGVVGKRLASRSKMCRFADKRCYHSRCSLFDCSSGDVGICPLHPNPLGFFMARMCKANLRSIFSKHRKGGR